MSFAIPICPEQLLPTVAYTVRCLSDLLDRYLAGSKVLHDILNMQWTQNTVLIPNPWYLFTKCLSKTRALIETQILSWVVN